MTIEEYIAGLNGDAKERILYCCSLTRKLVPQAEEKISWGMPTFKYNGKTLHFCAFKNHMSIYPGEMIHSSNIAQIVKGFKTTKGGIQLPYSQPFPEALIETIIKARFEL